MDGLEMFRRSLRQAAAVAVGGDARQNRYFTSQLSVSGAEGDFRVLPSDPTEFVQLQNSSGNFYAVAGISAVGGGDIVKGG